MLNAAYWFCTPNPNLGGMAPLNMIHSGRGEKLYKWIDTRLWENTRREPPRRGQDG